MLSLDEQLMIEKLSEANISASDIARKIGRSIGTIYNYRKKTNISHISSDVPSFPKTLQPFADSLTYPHKNITKLFSELQIKGYRGSYATLQRHMRTVTAESSTRRPYKPAVKVNVAPGEQAQVDWASFGSVHIDGRKEKLYAFFYILSYSRMLYVEFVVRQNQQTLQDCHINAFEKLGIPKAIRYDNMKTVVISHPRKNKDNNEEAIKYNPAFIDFARYYDFEVVACPPYWPRAKGRVEASVKYIRSAFVDKKMLGRNFTSLSEINAQMAKWLQITAHQRIHRSTCAAPHALWLEEKSSLSFPKTLPRYQFHPTEVRHSTKDGLVAYKSNLYSIPQRFARRKLHVHEVTDHGLAFLEINHERETIARHKISYTKGDWIVNENHAIDIELEKNDLKIKSTKQPHKKRRDVVVIQRDLSYYDTLLTGG